jgi:hypothetical protein
MNNEEKDKIYNKWDPIINSIGLTGLASEDTTSEFPSLLPIAMRVAAKTIGQDIGGFASKEEINSVKNRITQENRDGKIESIIDDKLFTEKKLEEDQEYKDLMKRSVTPMSGPSGKLFYLDFKYGTASN